MLSIDRPSVASLLLLPRANGNQLSTATGFVIQEGDQAYLITNWHVLAARNPVTSENLHPSGAWPDEVIILHNLAGNLGQWEGRNEPVRDPDGPLWFEHPTHGRRVDVVALPLANTDGVDVYPYDFNGGADVAIGPAQQVSIVGFPFGRTGGGLLGIWVQGTIATEPGVDFDDLPCFLVDSRTRQGQSGSPAIFYSRGGAVATSGGGTVISAGPMERLLGVYSGRISPESDLGVVWKREVIGEILAAKVRGSD